MRWNCRHRFTAHHHQQTQVWRADNRHHADHVTGIRLPTAPSALSYQHGGMGFDPAAHRCGALKAPFAARPELLGGPVRISKAGSRGGEVPSPTYHADSRMMWGMGSRCACAGFGGHTGHQAPRGFHALELMQPSWRARAIQYAHINSTIDGPERPPPARRYTDD